MTIFVNTCTLQENKANFGLAKNTNREGNGHNFAWLMVAMGLHVNASKAQTNTIAKNT